ncbi:MAG: quinol:cytochrome C oxidoreductase [Flavobacteriaceae bacterium]
MYTFSGKLKTLSFVLMIVGALGIGYGFLSAPKSVQEVEQLLEKEHEAHHAHGGGHQDHHEVSKEEHDAHVAHVYHQEANKPWSALYVAGIFFFLISVGVLAFYAIQHASQAGWSPVVFRVMEGITAYVPIGGIIVFLLLLASVLHINHNHLFVWMDKDVVANDAIIQGKTSFLNTPFFLIRAAIFIAGWAWYRHVSRKISIRQDNESDNAIPLHKKMVKASAVFLVFFIVTESIASWDWIMSVDPHWYSTLFGWYVFASFFVSGVTVIALITIYLKSKGLLEYVNKSHIHDLAKYMFAFSIFWTYLWFSQFMLIWYSNIPEEVTYFIQRIEDYNLPFFGMVAINLIFPLVVLMSAEFKRVNWIVVFVGIILLFGHYMDFFTMIMPATVGDRWFIGVSEISSVLFFAGLFIFVVFSALSKQPLLVKNNPLIEESKHFHY